MNARLTTEDWVKRAPKPVAEQFDRELHCTPADLLDLTQEEINRAEEGLVKHHPNTMKALRRFADELHAAGALEEGNEPETGQGERADESPQAGQSEDDDDDGILTIPDFGHGEDEAPDGVPESVALAMMADSQTETDAAKEEGQRRARAAAFRKGVRERLKQGFPHTHLRQAPASNALLRPLNRKFTKWANGQGEEMALSLESVLAQVGADAERPADEFAEAFLVQVAA